MLAFEMSLFGQMQNDQMWKESMSFQCGLKSKAQTLLFRNKPFCPADFFTIRIPSFLVFLSWEAGQGAASGGLVRRSRYSGVCDDKCCHEDVMARDQ
jgi:hypothetical protein